MPKVLNKKTDKIPDDAVYIGRPSKWGNPYTVERYGRERAINLYRYHLLRTGLWKDARDELKGKDLVCYCAPEDCHGDVLLRVANPEMVL